MHVIARADVCRHPPRGPADQVEIRDILRGGVATMPAARVQAQRSHVSRSSAACKGYNVGSAWPALPLFSSTALFLDWG
jgi:hypothetical protein